MELKVGDRVLVYYCPDREKLAEFSMHDNRSQDADESLDEVPAIDEALDAAVEAMTSFEFHEGVVVDDSDDSYEKEGDYEHELCVALDCENEGSHSSARTFRAHDKVPNVWEEGPLYGGYSGTAVIIKKEEK